MVLSLSEATICRPSPSLPVQQDGGKKENRERKAPLWGWSCYDICGRVMEEAGASGQTSWLWFWPCSCFTAKALQLWVPLPPSCKVWFVKTRPSLQGAEKCRLFLVALEGITWACWGPATPTGGRQSPVTSRSGTKLPWQGLALGQQGCSRGAFWTGSMDNLLLEFPQFAVDPAKLVTAPLPHCCSGPFKMTP